MKTLLIVIGFWMFMLGSAITPGFAQENAAGSTQTITPKEIKTVIDSLDKFLNRYYVFPDKAVMMATYLKSQWKKGAYKNVKDPTQLATQLDTDLQRAHRDPHLRLEYDPSFSQRVTVKRSAKEMQEEGDQQLTFLRENNFFFKRVELLPGNIGYVLFNAFDGHIAQAKPTVEAAFRFLSHTRGIIIDLRTNGGGSPDMVSQMESYFFTEKTRMNDIIDRGANQTIELYADPAKSNGLTLTMPVYILTSKGTFSGAEDFSYGMQSVKRAVIVGDTTGGGAHPTRPFSIGHGFVAGIPFARSFNTYTKTDWEGTGVIPDIAVPSSQALSKAQSAIFTQLLEQATDDREKNRMRWQLNFLKAADTSMTFNSALFAQYTGIYQGGLNFYEEKGRLFCKNAERGNEVFELKPITNTLFVLDENVEVEFEKDSLGAYSSIKMYWIDGGISQKTRN